MYGALIALVLTGILIYPLTKILSTTLPRKNYRGESIPTAVGLIFPLISAPVILLTVGENTNSSTLVFTLLYFALLGLIDDALGNRDQSGFRGHLSSLLQGKFTTGGLKAILGGFGALITASLFTSGWEILLNGLIIALSANLFNLFDTRPGRCGKLFLVFSVLLVLADTPLQMALMVLTGSLLVYLPFDLQGRLMMGDSGSNVLGAAIGVAFIFEPMFFRVAVLGALLLLHLLAERYSFTKIIAGSRLLSFLDRIGRTD